MFDENKYSNTIYKYIVHVVVCIVKNDEKKKQTEIKTPKNPLLCFIMQSVIQSQKKKYNTKKTFNRVILVVCYISFILCFLKGYKFRYKKFIWIERGVLMNS